MDYSTYTVTTGPQINSGNGYDWNPDFKGLKTGRVVIKSFGITCNNSVNILGPESGYILLAF